MTELVLGLGCIAAASFLYRWIYGHVQYQKSIYQVLYAGYLEFYMKKKRIQRLSESTVLQELFGKHRIFYQIFSPEGKKELCPYLVLVLSSGIYHIRVLRQDDSFPQPLAELNQFGKKMQEKLNGKTYPIYKLAVFPNKSPLMTKGNGTSGVKAINRSELINTVKKIHEHGSQALDGPEIDAVWLRLARESLDLEVNRASAPSAP